MCIYYRNRDNGEYKTQKFSIFWPFLAKQYILEKNVLDKSCLCFYKLQITDLKFSSIVNRYRDNWEKCLGPNFGARGLILRAIKKMKKPIFVFGLRLYVPNFVKIG